MEPITSRGVEHCNTGGLQEKIGLSSARSALDSCTEQGVGLDGLIGPFQLNYSMILSDCLLYTSPSPRD